MGKATQKEGCVLFSVFSWLKRKTLEIGLGLWEQRWSYQKVENGSSSERELNSDQS